MDMFHPWPTTVAVSNKTLVGRARTRWKDQVREDVCTRAGNEWIQI